MEPLVHDENSNPRQKRRKTSHWEDTPSQLEPMPDIDPNYHEGSASDYASHCVRHCPRSSCKIFVKLEHFPESIRCTCNASERDEPGSALLLPHEQLTPSTASSPDPHLETGDNLSESQWKILTDMTKDSQITFDKPTAEKMRLAMSDEGVTDSDLYTAILTNPCRTTFPDPEIIADVLAREGSRALYQDLRRYFERTLPERDQVRTIGVEALKLDVTACLGVRFHSFMMFEFAEDVEPIAKAVASHAPWYRPEKVVGFLKGCKVAEAVWRVWSEAVDEVVYGLVVECVKREEG
ncbi:hypothetical protein EJ04DRAFT_582466 [Polyplosphaeria fusca]|uniref:Uncharacterized protein n=1 Tax=Polyplosphaeria fusca TaxID=682080 RepID=A0A9P4USJ0_9PLEO|nr:hypothetical protein EJ04DRAFT_582466 [Polyplosphaeria fusca]